MNIIITGPKHSGKSTIIKKILERYSHDVSGFITEFDDRSSTSRELILRNLTGSHARSAVKWLDGPYEVYPEVFDEFAPQLIDIDSSLVIIDELGKFERDCLNLEKRVCEAFNSRNHVVASIRLDAAGWAQQLKFRNDVIMFNISPDTRDEIPDIIMKMLTNNCKNR